MTPEELKALAKALGLPDTATAQEIAAAAMANATALAQATAQAAKAFYVAYEKRPTASGYNVDHSVGTFLVDPAGKVRLRAPHAQRAEWFADDIRLLPGGA